MAQITINEGLAWLRTLKKRHEELLALFTPVTPGPHSVGSFMG